MTNFDYDKIVDMGMHSEVLLWNITITESRRKAKQSLQVKQLSEFKSQAFSYTYIILYPSCFV